MPDAHVGMGATVGSVIPTNGRGDPVGGRRRHRLRHDRRRARRHRGPAARHARAAARSHRAGDPGRCRRGPRPGRPATPTAGSRRTRRRPSCRTTRSTKAAKQFGTLGSGNHFFELCVDERGRVWVVLHSGSRGIGNKLAHDAHHQGTQPREGTSSCGSRTRTSRTSSRARRSSRRTSPTCCGPRSTPGRTVTR